MEQLRAMVVRSQVGVGTQVDGELTVEIRMEMKKKIRKEIIYLVH